MRSPGRSRRTWWVLLPMLCLALWLVLWGDKTPVQQAAVSARVPTPSTPEVQPRAWAQQPATATLQAARAPSLVALVPRSLLIPSAGHSRLSRDLFAQRSWAPAPSPPPPAAAPAPMAPPLPFTYLGKQLEGATWQVFLARADQTFVVSAGSTIDGLYRIDAVSPPTLALTYLPLGQAQSMSIGDAQ